MPKTRQEKEIILNELVQKFQKFKSLVFINFAGLKVKDVSELRRLCEKEKIDYLVVKKTLIKLALSQVGIVGLDPKELKGNLALVFGFDDEVAPAKLLEKFAKDHEALKFLAGIVSSSPKEYRFLDEVAVKSLALLPSRTESLARVVGSIKAPLTGLVNVLAGNLRGFVLVLNALKEKKAA